MLDALVGAAIMVVATTSLLYSIEVAEKAFGDAGRYPLSKSERTMLKLVDIDDRDSQDKFLDSNLVWDNWCPPEDLLEGRCSE